MTLLHGSTLLTARTAFFISLRMARHLSSRQGAGAQEYGLYFKLLQHSIGGRGPAYAVARDLCNGRSPSCSSQAAREWYRLRRRQDAFSRGVPLFGRWKNSFFSVSAFLMGNSINRFLRFVNGSCRVLSRFIAFYRRTSSSSAAASTMTAAPASASARRPRKPQLTAASGSPAFRAVATSTSLSPT